MVHADEGAHASAAGVAVVSAAPQPFILAESGGIATATLRLRTRPTAAVEIRFIGDGQLRATSTAATIRPEQWSMGVDVAFAAVDDGVVEGPHVGAVRLELTSQDPTYDDLDVAPVTAMLVDDDEAGVRLTPAADVRVGEGASGAQVAVTLRAMPDAAVTVRFAPDAQTTLDVTELHFTPATWNVPQRLRIDAVDDAIDEDAEHASVVRITTSSTQVSFDRLVVEPLLARVFDDDRSDLVFDTPAPILLDESHPGVDVTGSVRLTSRPATPVTVTLFDLSGQLHLTNARLTFTAANWNVAQTWRVAPVADDVAEPRPHVLAIQTRVESADAPYAAVRRAPLEVQVQDDDAPGIALHMAHGALSSATGADQLRLDEGGPSTQVEVELASAPTAALTVRPVVAPGSQLTVTPASYTFPIASTRPRAVTFEITSVDDSVDEDDPHAATITWRVDTIDPAYLATDLPDTVVRIGDDDEAGIDVVAAGSMTLREDRGEQLVTVVLRSQPTHQVVVSLEPDAQTTAVGLTRSLRFDPATWSQPQVISVAAFDDHVAEPSPHPGRIGLRVTSGDPRYGPIQLPALELAITDDDEAVIVVTATGTDNRVTEGGAVDVVELRLGSQPAGPVTLTVASDPQVVAEPASITIEPVRWDQPQRVTLTAVQDDLLEGEQLALLGITASGGTTGYQGSTSTIDVHVVDDETAGLTIRQSGDITAVVEGGIDDSFDVALAARPSGDVAVSLAPDAQVDVTPRTLTFTPASWNQWQEVHVSAVQDTRDEPEFHPGVVTLHPSSDAPGWSGAPDASIGVRVSDDDRSSVTFTATGGSTRVTEGGAGDTVLLQLTSQPTAPVEIAARPDGQTTASAPVTIVPAAWQRPVTIRIDAVNDDDVEGDHLSSVEFTIKSTDVAYRRQSIPALDVAVVDDDEEGVATQDDEVEDTESTEPVIPRPPVAPGVVGPRDARDATSGTFPAGSQGTARPDHDGVALPRPVDSSGTMVTGSGPGRSFDGEQASDRTPVDDGEPRRPSAIDGVRRWIGDHALLVGALTGLLTITGVGIGWIRLRDPMRGI